MANILTLKRILLTIAAAASLTVAGTAMATAGNSGSTLPGWGFGDKNHVHTGPPGNSGSGCQDAIGKHCCNTVSNSVHCCNNNSANKKCCDQNTADSSNSANKCKDHDGDNDGDNDVDENTVHDNTVHTNAVH